MEDSKPTQKTSNSSEVVVLRWGHRPQRDVRLTTHVALTARALCASGFILSDVEDRNIEKTVNRISDRWGGRFQFQMGIPWKKVVAKWRANGGVIVHLTAYGENIQTSDVLQRIKNAGKDILIVVGSQKVPGDFYSEQVSDFNVSVGNQPHSECAALAVFLDRLFGGEELARNFEKAKMKIVPSARGKTVSSQAEH